MDDRTNHTKRAVFQLRQWIIGGEVPGGSRLREIAVAERLRISRTPVRAAMAQLAAEGLLERAGTGGFVVRAFSLRDAVDAIELRGILEGTAARMAAEEGVDGARLAAIQATVARLDGCFCDGGLPVDFECYSELNTVFHEQLADLCGSTIIKRELERVKSLPFASPSAFVLDRQEGAASQTSLIVAQDQHKAMVAAIEAREGYRAEAIAREHARTARANLLATTMADIVIGAASSGIPLIST